MKQVELKPCPFCGGKATMYTFSVVKDYHVSCDGCGAYSDDYRTPKKAAAAWNRRAEVKP